MLCSRIPQSIPRTRTPRCFLLCHPGNDVQIVTTHQLLLSLHSFKDQIKTQTCSICYLSPIIVPSKYKDRYLYISEKQLCYHCQAGELMCKPYKLSRLNYSSVKVVCLCCPVECEESFLIRISTLALWTVFCPLIMNLKGFQLMQISVTRVLTWITKNVHISIHWLPIKSRTDSFSWSIKSLEAMFHHSWRSC